MKIHYKHILLLAILVATMIGCNTKKTDTSPTLSVTNMPQKYFLEEIVGNKFIVNSIIPPGVNPESMDLTPSQLIALVESKAYFKIGFLAIEDILIAKVKESNKEIKIIECSAHIDVIREEEHEHEHAHQHDEKDSSVGHNHADGDPHTWSSPHTAKQIAKNMYEAVVLLDDDNKDYYTSNYQRLIDKIEATNLEIKAIIGKSASKSFIIYHPSLSYFAREYDLRQYAIEHEGKNPSPLQLKQLIDNATADSVKVVFIQEEFDTKNAETIAKSINATTVRINLLAYDWHNEMITIAKAIASQPNE